MGKQNPGEPERFYNSPVRFDHFGRWWGNGTSWRSDNARAQPLLLRISRNYLIIVIIISLKTESQRLWCKEWVCLLTIF